MTVVLLFYRLCTVVDRLGQFDRGESEYDDVREDGVWGEETALVGWILVDSCSL